MRELPGFLWECKGEALKCLPVDDAIDTFMFRHVPDGLSREALSWVDGVLEEVVEVVLMEFCDYLRKKGVSASLFKVDSRFVRNVFYDSECFNALVSQLLALKMDQKYQIKGSLMSLCYRTLENFVDSEVFASFKVLVEDVVGRREEILKAVFEEFLEGA